MVLCFVLYSKRVRPLDQSPCICCEADSPKRRPAVSVLVVETKTNSKTTPKILRIVTRQNARRAKALKSHFQAYPRTNPGSVGFEVFACLPTSQCHLGVAPHCIHGYTMQIQVRGELVLYRRTTRKCTSVRNCEVSIIHAIQELRRFIVVI